MANTCNQVRRALIEHSTLKLGSGEIAKGRRERVVQPCAAPLFSEAERKSGFCRSCASSWTHPHNHPVNG